MKNIRASRLLGSDARTSHKPPLKGRHNGKPTGQPYCTLAMSRPMVRLSPRDNSFSHSRTGSRPLADRQNTRGIGLRLSAFTAHCTKKDTRRQASILV